MEATEATAAVELGLGLVAGFGGVVAWCEIGVRLADDFPVSLDVAFAVTDDFCKTSQNSIQIDWCTMPLRPGQRTASFLTPF